MASIASATLPPAERALGLSWHVSRPAQAAIDRLGRTEDLQFSPSGRQLALAGTITKRLLILDLGFDRTAAAPRIAVTDFLEIDSGGFNAPHGVCWLDERVLAVANRGGTVALVELPAVRPNDRRARLEPIRCHGKAPADRLSTPGSLSARALGLDLVELLVCNNLSSQVSRHLVDRRRGYEVLMSEALLQDGIDLPDGVAHSPSGAWLAVSNHNAQCVFVYDNQGDLNLSTRPRAVLGGICYPHGLAFSADEQWLAVADAGAPYVHLFQRGQDWAGERHPAASVRVMSNPVFDRGRFSPKEGGPKGIDLNGRILAITAQNEPLAFFDLGEIIGTGPGTQPSVDRKSMADAESARTAMMRYLHAARTNVDLATQGVLHAAEREVALLKSTRSWRVTAPLRRLSAVRATLTNWRRQRRARPPGSARPGEGKA